VIERIRNNQIAPLSQGGNDPEICGIAGGKQQGLMFAHPISDEFLQLAMLGVGAMDESRSAGTQGDSRTVRFT
jgi:hypothetical protein